MGPFKVNRGLTYMAALWGVVVNGESGATILTLKSGRPVKQAGVLFMKEVMTT